MPYRGIYESVVNMMAEVMPSGSTDVTSRARVWRCLERASRIIDEYCGRHFYPLTATRYYDGYDVDGDDPLKIWVDDLLSVTALTVDYDGDGVFEETLVENTDFRLWPYNDDVWPKLALVLDTYNGQYSYWPGAGRAIKCSGVFGYGDGSSASPYVATGGTVTVANGTTLTLTLAGMTIERGQLLLVEAEQMYAGDDNLLVARAVNGTTGIAHAAKAAYVAQFPPAVSEACLRLAARAFARKSTPFALAGPDQFGHSTIIPGDDPDISRALAPFRRAPNLRAV